MLAAATESEGPRYMCASLRNEHNHDPDSTELLMKSARESLRKEVLDKPVGSDHKKVYYRWIDNYINNLEEEERETFVSNFPVYESMKTTMWRQTIN